MPAKAETSVEDQFCNNANISSAEDAWLIRSHAPLYQTFTPTKNRLTEIDVAVEGGADVGASIKMELSLVGGEVLISQSKSTTIALPQWLTYTFEPIILDTTKQYQIALTTTFGTPMWVVSAVQCYAGGTAFIDGTSATAQDFGFITKGYNVTPPASTPEPTPTTIAKPTALTAEYLGQTEGVKVDWSASSTTDITGYYVYRSESATTGFVKIETVAKPTTEYIDHGIIEEVTYYYQVRAYKGTLASAASPTASVKIPTFVVEEETEEPVLDSDIATTQEETTTSPKSTFIDSISNYLIAGAFLLLAIIAIVIFFVTRKKTPKTEVKKEAVTTPLVEPTKIEEKEEKSTVEEKAKEI